MITSGVIAAASPQADRGLAEQLRTAALDRRAALDDDSALVLYRAARRADPRYLPAQYEYIALMWEQLRGPELRREFPAGDSTAALPACLAAAAQVTPDDRRPIDRLKAIERQHGPSPCTDIFLLALGEYSAARGSRALRESPDVRDVRANVASAMAAAGQAEAADRLLRARSPATANPLSPVLYSLLRVSLRLGHRDTAGAVAAWQSVATEVRRDGRPGVVAVFLFAECTAVYPHPVRRPSLRAGSCAELSSLLRTHRARFAEWDMTRRQAKDLLETGELTRAMPLLDRSVAIADSIGLPGVRLVAYTARGRAHSRQGRLAAALRDLRRAIALGPAAGSPYYLADAYHQLAHAYEAAGRLRDAAFAADTFALIADSLPGTPGRYMSQHDAGMIRWAAGWHASAARNFDAMVRIIDEHDSGHFFAGEYFERVGNLGRAIEYYRAGARSDATPDPRNFAALARLYESIGQPDSAEAAARRHDASRDRWPILERPLLSDLLARRGRVREAIAVAEQWTVRERLAGNVQGEALAQLNLGELLLLGRQPQRAAGAASIADSLSRMMRLTAERIRARTLRGRALVGQGQHDRGLAELRAAVRLATAHPSTSALLSTNLALGHALVATTRAGDALAAYDRAAVAVETMTAGLEEDVTRASFKAIHLAPFDGALHLLSSQPSAGRHAAAALEWSARRKAAALALASGRSEGRSTMSPSHVRARLRANEALIDFSLTDSLTLAVVARRESIAMVTLAVSSSRLTTWIEALRRPMVTTPGGRIDLAHAVFDGAVAESLHAAIVAPLAPHLQGVERLAIVPDGALWYLPFPALVVHQRGGAGRPTYLVERYEMRFLPSAAFISAGGISGALPRGFRVEALSHAVPGGAEEIAAIQAALGPARVTTHDGSAATERAGLRAAAEVLHVAAHGIVNDRYPLASHLRLAPDATSDGLLQQSEIGAARIRPRTVVLTACEAVSGKLYAGEGLVGLARAFLLSGARQVIASQWPVDASAVTLTRVLYGGLASGQEPSEALRSAQLALMKQPATAHPIHWAGFVLFEGGAATGARFVSK